MEQRWNEIDRGKRKYSGEKPLPVPLCPPHIPHGLTGDRTRASAVRDRRLPWHGLATCLYWITATHLHLVLCCVCIEPPYVGRPKRCVVFVSYCTWAESPFHCGTTCCPLNLYPSSTSVDNVCNGLQSSSSSWPSTVIQVLTYWQRFVPVLHVDRLSLQSELHSCSSDMAHLNCTAAQVIWHISTAQLLKWWHISTHSCSSDMAHFNCTAAQVIWHISISIASSDFSQICHLL
jgi:hypothetical protein